MADGDDIEKPVGAHVAAATTTVEEQTVPFGLDGSLRLNPNFNLTCTITGITPQLAEHQQALAKVYNETEIERTRIESERDVKVAELTHLSPVRATTRPIWAAIGVLGATLFAALWSHNTTVAVAAIVALGGVFVVREAGRVLKDRGSGKE